MRDITIIRYNATFMALVNVGLLSLIMINIKMRDDHPIVFSVGVAVFIMIILTNIIRIRKDYITIGQHSMDFGGKVYSYQGLRAHKMGIATVVLDYDNYMVTAEIGIVSRLDYKIIDDALRDRIRAQQVDSAEPSTNAVPPSTPPGSAR